jgi:GntR family transcriptional regulator
VRAHNTVELVAASVSEAHLLHVETDAPLLRFSGVAFDADDRALEFTTALWSGQVRFHFGSQNRTGKDAHS